jgi:two-component system, chemotaxis family, protein-glutamate methylesterase/glutaminase
MNLDRKIRVLVVDDSAVVRQAITQALSQDPGIEVVGSACDPYVARDRILELNPDVLTLDIEMPRMDGLTFLRILQKHRPMPVVVVSSLTQAGSRAALDALAAGAVDVIAKPSSAWSIGELHDQLIHRVKGAAFARIAPPAEDIAPPVRAAEGPASARVQARQLIVCGASTGGTEALKSVLTRLPPGMPGICIVQHIPPFFSRAFAERLNELCAFEVREAVANDVVRPGLALIAPGDFHMVVAWKHDHFEVALNQNPPLHHTRPAVDVLFNSAAAAAGQKAIALLLTGMGTDGANGMLKLKAAGAATLAQDEATCVVYGMPRAAVELGAVDQILPLDRIPAALLRAVQAGAAAPPGSPAARPTPSPKL